MDPWLIIMHLQLYYRRSRAELRIRIWPVSEGLDQDVILLKRTLKSSEGNNFYFAMLLGFRYWNVLVLDFRETCNEYGRKY